MSAALRRGFATALLLLTLLAVAPALLPQENDGLPAFDDTDDSDGAGGAAFLRSDVAAVLALTTPPGAPRLVVSMLPPIGDLPSEAVLRRALPTRSPPGS